MESMWPNWPDFLLQWFNALMRLWGIGKAVKINPNADQQVALFPETNPLLDELKGLDVNGLSPIEALNKLFERQKEFLKE